MFQRKDLFEGTRPARLGIDGETEMPILYYKDACAYFYFTADAEEVQKRLPSDNLHVVKVSPTRCMVALATYNYIHASVGSYGETVMVAICTHDKVPKGPLPLIRQARDATSARSCSTARSRRSGRWTAAASCGTTRSSSRT